MNDLQQMSLFPPRNIGDLMADIEILKKEIQELYCQDELPLVIGWSGGKIVRQSYSLSGMRLQSCQLRNATKKFMF